MADVVVTNDVDTFLKSANQAAMRTNIGAGTIATQNANNVSITGGSVTGITDLAIADGGTGASTAAAARTNLEVYSDAEVDAKVATKAVAGGVRLTNKGRIINTNSIWDSSSFTLVWVGGKIDTANSNSEGNLLMIASSGNADIPLTGTGFTNGIQLQTTSTAMRLKIGDGDLSYFQQGLNAAFRTSIVTNQEIAEIVITYDAASNVLKTYLNGTEYAIAQPANSLAVWNSGFTNPRAVIGGDTIATDASVVRYLTCTVNDFKWFNRALSAAEVADLYESGTVAVADRWGNPTPVHTSDFSVNAQSWTGIRGTVAGNIDSIGGLDDVARYTSVNQAGDQGFRNTTLVSVGIKYRISGKIYIPSTNVELDGFSIQDTSGTPRVYVQDFSPTLDSWVDFSGETITGTTAIDIEGRNNGSQEIRVDNDVFYIKDIKIEKIGCIADLPLDEGIGYQFHDRSSNHFDALASTTGVTHLVPKTEGKVRVKAADASSAMYMLRADSILPTDSIISNVLSEQCYVDLTNSAQTLDDYRIRLNPSLIDLQIQRSDGSNHQTLGTVTAPASLSNVDVEVQYKQVIR